MQMRKRFFLLQFLVCAVFLLLNGCTQKIETGEMQDFDGNRYRTIKIGEQWWMAENLKVTHYRNGEVIPNIIGYDTWENLETGAYCSYGNIATNAATYGLLFNWFAVNDSRGLAPTGWHVPSDVEWKHLEMHLGMSQSNVDLSGWRGTDEGGKLKESGMSHWNNPNEGATNESGFSALPGAYRFSNGSFGSIGGTATFWSATEDGKLGAWTRGMHASDPVIRRDGYNKQYGFSVRCVRD